MVSARTQDDGQEVEMGFLRSVNVSQTSDESSDDSSDEACEERGARSPKTMAVGVVAAAAIMAIVAYASLGKPVNSGLLKYDVGATIEADEVANRTSSASDSVTVAPTTAPASASASGSTIAAPTALPPVGGSSALVDWTTGVAASATAAAQPSSGNSRRKPSNIVPKESMHDGNTCDDSEEKYGGLCYTKCSVLTDGKAAFRATAFSCCPTKSCAGDIFKLQTASLIPCKGYDVSSPNGATSCPHVPGDCLTDEEMFLGECFEKCSILTDGKFPNRVAALSCCATHGLACLNPFNDKTSGKMAVGGGAGDGNAATPSKAHFPSKALTETK